MKISTLDNIRDCLEEGEHAYGDMDVNERYEVVAFMQSIIDMHTFDERFDDVEVKVKIDR